MFGTKPGIWLGNISAPLAAQARIHSRCIGDNRRLNFRLSPKFSNCGLHCLFWLKRRPGKSTPSANVSQCVDVRSKDSYAGGKADIDCIRQTGFHNCLRCPLVCHERRVSIRAATTNRTSGSFAINLPITNGPWLYRERASFLPRIPFVAWPIGRSLRHVIVRIVGTWFVGRRAVFGPDPRLSGWLDPGGFAGDRELVCAAALHGRIREDLERLQDSLPVR